MLSEKMIKTLVEIGEYGVTSWGCCQKKGELVHLNSSTITALIERGLLEETKRKFTLPCDGSKWPLFRVSPFFWRSFFDFYWWIERQGIEVGQVTDQHFNEFAAIMSQVINPNYVAKKVKIIRSYWSYVQARRVS